MAIWITQWLCAQRHCAFAIPWDDTTTTPQEIERQGLTILEKKLLNPWCGICKGEVKPEHGRTTFATMEEALPHLEAGMHSQLESRRLLDILGISKEKLPEDTSGNN